MEHTKHIWRAALILLGVAIVSVSVRQFLIPKSFGELGFYRRDSLAEFMSAPVVHGGDQACAPCHTETADVKAEGSHAPVRCEVCHAPVTVHAQGQEKTGEMPINRSHKLCAYCHQQLRGRPETIAQVDIMGHLKEQEALEPGEEIPEGICVVCHDPHEL